MSRPRMFLWSLKTTLASKRLIGNQNPLNAVYESRPTGLELFGSPVLTDFGQMRSVRDRANQDWWMSDLYRAPEVLLHLSWGYPVDIWHLVNRCHGEPRQHISMTLRLIYQFRPSSLWMARTLSTPSTISMTSTFFPRHWHNASDIWVLRIIRQSPHFMNFFDAEGNESLSRFRKIYPN